MTQPDPDIRIEAERLVGAAQATQLPLRLLGGLAVRRHAAGGLDPHFDRDYKDIDFATTRPHTHAVIDFLLARGYSEDRTFNSLNGHRRLLFYDEANERQLDVFIDTFSMCHVLPFAERLERDSETLPLAELVLTKLQIYELNPKDRSDLFALLYHHEVGCDDRDTINETVIAALCARDWGLWRTCHLNITRLQQAIAEGHVPEPHSTVISARLDELRASIDHADKTRAWRLRNRVGDRVRWYREPEEVG